MKNLLLIRLAPAAYFVCVLGVFLFSACKKDSLENDLQEVNVLSQFFQLSPNTDAEIVKLKDALLAIENKAPYAHRIAKYHGLPIWEKTIKNTFSNGNQSFLVPLKKANEKEIVAFFEVLKQGDKSVQVKRPFKKQV